MEIRNEELYSRAKDKYMHRTSADDLREAKAIFEQLGDYEGAKGFAERCATLLEYEMGNTVTFGSYNGKPIRWRVLDERGKLRMLFSEEILTERAYNDEITDTSWRDCTLRKWLNKEFLAEAFSPKERAAVVSGMVRNPRSAKWFTSGGYDSMDKVFVLNQEEFDKYLTAPADRVKGKWWWLRSPGSNLMSAVAVYDDGTAYDIGIHVHYTEGGVRPALWVLLRV